MTRLPPVLIFVALLATSCLPATNRDTAATAQLARIDQSRSAWHTSRGPRQAVEFARAVHDALAAGAYRVDPRRWERDLPESIKALDLAASIAGGDAAQLVAWRAVRLGDNGQPAEALQEYRRSLSIGPTYLAAAGLAAYHGQSGDLPSLHTVCSSAAPELSDADRFDLMETCQRASKALTEEAGLPWASSADLEWYRAEQERRRQLAAAEAQAVRDKAKQDLGARREQMEVNKMCRDECSETESRCYASCGSVAYRACAYGCESRAKQCRQSCK